MSGAVRTFLSTLLVLVTATVLSAGEMKPAPADGRSLSAQQWTQYDWNASSGTTGAARFEILQDKEGALLRITSPAPNDARFVRELAVEPDTVYRLACQARSQNVGTEGRGAGISVTDILDGSADIKGSGTGWQSLEFYGKTGPDQNRLSVTVGIGGYGSMNSGTAWFRDVTVKKVASVPAGYPGGAASASCGWRLSSGGNQAQWRIGHRGPGLSGCAAGVVGKQTPPGERWSG